MLNYIPTMQSPLQGNNLPNVLGALKGQPKIAQGNALGPNLAK